MFSRKSSVVFASLLLLAFVAAACAAPTAPAPVVQTVVVPVPQTVVSQQTVVVPGAPQVVTATPAPTKAPPGGTPAPKTINVAATWGGSERDAFLAVIDAFTAKTGIQVNYESMRNNEGAILRTRVAAGNPPDIAMEPRPGEVAEFARSGNLVDLSFMKDDLSKAFNQGYLDVGNVDGKQVGFVWKANSKSTLWYRAADFKANGWTAPKTLADFTALADKIVAAGKVPMATDGSSQSAWVLSDYLENTVIRRMTAQKYNDLYVSHKVAWTDPAVKQALTDYALFFKPGYQLNGTQGVLAGAFPNMIAQVFGPTP